MHNTLLIILTLNYLTLMTKQGLKFKLLKSKNEVIVQILYYIILKTVL